jgi:hypothetical protein
MRAHRGASNAKRARGQDSKTRSLTRELAETTARSLSQGERTARGVGVPANERAEGVRGERTPRPPKVSRGVLFPRVIFDN